MNTNLNIAITLNKVNKSYGNKKIINNLSLNIEQGTIYGLLGPSGCGKSTIVKMMAGILKPDEGDVLIFNNKMPNIKLTKDIGYMAQAAALYPTLSAYENMDFFASLYSLNKNERKKRILEVSELVNLQESLKSPVSTFSGGMKQRLSLAITLLSNPKILILDEPTVGIDPLLRKDIWNKLNILCNKGTTIVVTTHVMDEAEKCNNLSMIRNGHIIVSGTPKDIEKKANVNTIEDAFIYFSKESITKIGGEKLI